MKNSSDVSGGLTRKRGTTKQQRITVPRCRGKKKIQKDSQESGGRRHIGGAAASMGLLGREGTVRLRQEQTGPILGTSERKVHHQYYGVGPVKKPKMGVSAPT